MKNADSVDTIQSFIREVIAGEMKEPIESIDLDANFNEFGLDSINSLHLLQTIEEQFEVELNQLYFWDYPTIRTFSEQLFKESQHK